MEIVVAEAANVLNALRHQRKRNGTARNVLCSLDLGAAMSRTLRTPCKNVRSLSYRQYENTFWIRKSLVIPPITHRVSSLIAVSSLAF